MNYILTFCFTNLLIFSSCKKHDQTCIEELFDGFKTNSGCFESQIDEYLFSNKTVYVFENQFCCCDHTSDVYDTDCNNLGFLGGIQGNS